MRWFSLLALLFWSACAWALSSSGSRLLVVLDENQEAYSTLWSDLKERGYTITFKSPKDEQLSLFEHGERAYDHLMILPPKSKGLGPSLTPKILLDFVNQEGNVLLALSGKSSTPSAISSLLIEFDIHISPDRSSVVVDHFNYDVLSAAESHDVLVLPQPKPVRSDVKSFFAGDGVLALPRTAGQALGYSSPLLVPILQAPETAYAYNSREKSESADDGFATGTQLALVSALQARNSARFTVLGSVEALEDQWFTASVKKPGSSEKTAVANREFAKRLTAWTFKELGVLKVGKIEHYLSDKEGNVVGDINPTIYRVKNDVTFNIELSEYDMDKFVPFEVPSGDAIQLEFTMLSPWHRLNLQPKLQTSNSTVFSTSFKVPDRHGVFSFRINYRRPFLTNVEEKHEITIRHIAHNEFPRSWTITGAWVWIAGLWSVIGGFLAFVILWLYSAPSPIKAKSEKKVQ